MIYKNIETNNFASFAGIPNSLWKPATKEELFLLELENYKINKKNEIDKQRDYNLSKPYKFIQKGKTHYLSKDFEKELLWLKSAGKETIADWVTIDNDIIKISKKEYKAIVVDMGEKTMNRITKARKIKDKILPMDNIREIEDYPIDEILLKE